MPFGSMAGAENSLVYFVLGAAGSGRREVLRDLIENGLDENERVVVLLAADEAADPTDAVLPGLARWTLENGMVNATPVADATHIFFVADGRGDPADQVEAFQNWLAATGGELARVLCVVNCRLAEQNPPLLAWYDACVHFADVVLLNRREGVANKWMSDFQNRYRDKFFPALFEMVKSGRVKNPALVLEPQARRITHVFDDEQEWIATNDEGQEIAEEDQEDEEEVTMQRVEDTYLERRQGGRRVRELPDVNRFLPPRE